MAKVTEFGITELPIIIVHGKDREELWEDIVTKTREVFDKTIAELDNLTGYRKNTLGLGVCMRILMEEMNQ